MEYRAKYGIYHGTTMAMVVVGSRYDVQTKRFRTDYPAIALEIAVDHAKELVRKFPYDPKLEATKVVLLSLRRNGSLLDQMALPSEDVTFEKGLAVVTRSSADYLRGC
jgi:hypothetical protein